jgi:hypothetical protein
MGGEGGRAAPRLGVVVSSKRRVRAAHGRAREAKSKPTSYQYLCQGSYQKSACCRYFDPFTIGSPVKNKHHLILHSRHLASHLVYETEGVVRNIAGGWGYPQQINISMGLVGEAVILSFLVDSAQEKSHILWLGLRKWKNFYQVSLKECWIQPEWQSKVHFRGIEISRYTEFNT